MDLQKIQMILAVAGAVALGLPAVLRALEAFFAVIPGSQPDQALAKVRSVSEKIADIVSKLYPKSQSAK